MDTASGYGASGRGRVAILGGLRTPWVKLLGGLEEVHAAELMRLPAEELLLRLGIPVKDIDEVIVGNGGQPADAMNIARVIALRLGIPQSVPAHTVHRNCASGMEAMTQAFDRIQLGRADLILCGGSESMSQAPLFYNRHAKGVLTRLSRARGPLGKAGALVSLRPSDFFRPVVGLQSGLTDGYCGLNMGVTAENLACEFAIARHEQDALALESHRRAIQARDAGFFAGEIVPVHPPPDFGEIRRDIGPRENQSLEALEKLRPYFDRRHGTVTPGNACGLTDGGCALLVASEQRAKALGVEPLGWIRSYSYRGCPPERMGLGPAFATPAALEAAGMDLASMDRIELNEAFAAQVIANRSAFESREFAERELGRTAAIGELDPQKLNVNGGAIALGHPVGATGARLVLTLLRELERSDLETGLATLCIGGGQGGAVVVERR